MSNFSVKTNTLANGFVQNIILFDVFDVNSLCLC